MSIDDEVHKRIIEFAKSNPKVLAILKGSSPEEEQQIVYYFVLGRGCGYDDVFSKRLSDLSIEIYRELEVNVSLMECATSVEDAKELFSIEKVIYQKKESR